MRSFFWLVVAAPLFVACESTSVDAADAQWSDVSTNESGASLFDAAVAPSTDHVSFTDAGIEASVDGASIDGVPMPQPCTSHFGTGLTGGSFGRLDGFLVAVVQPGGHSCSSDSGHLHLQVQMNNAVYDIAANVDDDVDFTSTNHALVGSAWSEGWHTDAQLDYVTVLGLHTSDFTNPHTTALTTVLVDALASANHVSVFASRYSASGAHLVHRNGRNHDGAIVIDPLGPSPRYLVFHFPDQSF